MRVSMMRVILRVLYMIESLDSLSQTVERRRPIPSHPSRGRRGLEPARRARAAPRRRRREVVQVRQTARRICGRVERELVGGAAAAPRASRPLRRARGRSAVASGRLAAGARNAPSLVQRVAKRGGSLGGRRRGGAAAAILRSGRRRPRVLNLTRQARGLVAYVRERGVRRLAPVSYTHLTLPTILLV